MGSHKRYDDLLNTPSPLIKDDKGETIDPYKRCNELLKAPNPFITDDLETLKAKSIEELVDKARKLYDNMKEFEKTCFNVLNENWYVHGMSMYHLALLKLSTALEIKLKDTQIDDQVIKFILDYFTPDEKNILRELERLSKLGSVITSPDKLSDIIVAEGGDVLYGLIRAIDKGYTDLAKIIDTWKHDLKIKDYVARALVTVYNARVKNVVNSIKILIAQQPGWLKRLFKEYERALVKSAEIRAKFEEEFRRVFSVEMASLENRLRSLEEENASLRDKLMKINSLLYATEDEKRRREEELIRLRQEYEDIRVKYEAVLRDFAEKISELENLKKTIQEKEKELKEMKNSKEATIVEKIVLENELHRLKETLKKYEEERARYSAIENRLKELESIIAGKSIGNLITREELEYYYEVIVGRARRLIEEGNVSLMDPRSSEKIFIKNWSNVERFSLDLSDATNPLTVRGIRFIKLSGLVSKKKDVVVEYVVPSHITDSSQKFDNIPISLLDIMNILRDRIVVAEREGYYHVLIVCSPTGFTEELVKHFSSTSPLPSVFVSKYMNIYLVDLIKGRVYYNQNDPVAKHNSFLANIELPEEQVERVVNYLLSDEAKIKAIERSPTVKFLYVEDIIKYTGVVDRVIIRRALEILQEKKVGHVKIVNDQLVFVYEKI